jgi:hypothetical protein
MGCMINKPRNDLELDNINPNHIINWKLYTGENIPVFSLKKIYLQGKVIDVHDGNTISCIFFIPLYNTVFNLTVRLYGVNTCDIKSKNSANRKKGLQAREYLLYLILKNNNRKVNFNSPISQKKIKNILSNNICLINVYFDGFDTHDRALGWLFSNKIKKKSAKTHYSYNNLMIINKFAYKYDKNIKLTEEEQLKILS